jgi:hypothetical protein
MIAVIVEVLKNSVLFDLVQVHVKLGEFVFATLNALRCRQTNCLACLFPGRVHGLQVSLFCVNHFSKMRRSLENWLRTGQCQSPSSDDVDEDDDDDEAEDTDEDT